MNDNTRELLKDYIDEIKDLAYSVSNVCGTETLERVIKAGEKLKDQLDSDETIL